MRQLVGLLLALLMALSFSPRVAWAVAPGGARAQTLSAAGAQQQVKRGLGQTIKAGWRKLGKVGQGAAILLVGGGAAFGMHHAGMSPTETVAVLGGTATVGLGTLGLIARRARQLWSGSFAAKKLAKIDEAHQQGSFSRLPSLIGELKTEVSRNQLGDGKDKVKARESAFLALSLVRAELALNDSPDPKERTSGATLASWESHLGGLDGQASSQITKTSEGKLALGLKDIAAEIAAESAVVSRHQQVVAHFEDHVPLAFGGEMSKQAKTTKAMVGKLHDEEIGGEKALHAKLTTKMRGRVSDRLSGERGDFKQRRERHASLKGLRDGLLGDALREAREADSHIDSALSDRQQEAYYEQQALQHTADVEHYTDHEGKQQTRTVDNSAQYRSTAASYASSAQSHTRSANAAMSTLAGLLQRLKHDPTMHAEQLDTPGHHGLGGADTGPGWSSELFLPTSFNQWGNISAQWSLRDASSAVSRKLGALRQLDGEVARRESGERTWLDQQIDADLSHQIASVAP